MCTIIKRKQTNKKNINRELLRSEEEAEKKCVNCYVKLKTKKTTKLTQTHSHGKHTQTHKKHKLVMLENCNAYWNKIENLETKQKKMNI